MSGSVMGDDGVVGDCGLKGAGWKGTGKFVIVEEIFPGTTSTTHGLAGSTF